MPQALLFPDPKPLDQRLGKKFFRNAPRRPGVYLMKDASGRVVYVGKAKDLKQRLNNYRLANPDRMPRRHLRMVREVARIEFQFCVSEAAALQRESKLLRTLRPKFNRAGVWQGRPRFVVWRLIDERLEWATAEIPENGWRRFGPLNGIARFLHDSCCRLIWLAVNPHAYASQLPAGWAGGAVPESASIHCGVHADVVQGLLQEYFWGDGQRFLSWLQQQFAHRTNPFDQAIIAADCEPVQNFLAKRPAAASHGGQLALL